MQIRNKQSLTGKISGKQGLKAGILSKGELTGHTNVSTVYTAQNEPYTGPYSVTPSTESETLHTKDMLMTDDVIILEIPFHVVTNNSGGMTATIGGE